VYSLKVENNKGKGKGTLHLTRLLNMDLLIVEASFIRPLRNFFQIVRTGDEQQVVLQRAQRRRVIEDAAYSDPSHMFVCCWAAAGAVNSSAGDAPAWMHALVNAPLPAHDEKTDVVRFTPSETSRFNPRTRSRPRPGSIQNSSARRREYGTVGASFNSRSKITGMRRLVYPTQGKD